MEYRMLGRTNVEVSILALGTMTWGEQNSEAEAHNQMDYAFDQGINLFDGAELYPIPPKPETQGRTEEYIGNWVCKRNTREKLILASKVVGRTKYDWFRDDGSEGRLTPKQIREACEKSLRRFKTDYIDLYQIHWPDRPTNWIGTLEYRHKEDHHHPVEETVAVLGDLINEGKIRFGGISNETPWGAMNYLNAATNNDHPRIVTIQNAYSLVNRTFEIALSEIAHREQVGLLAYSPLGQGYLTGKYENEAMPQGSRKQLFNRLQRYETTSGRKAITAYIALARKHGLDPAQMALSFAMTRPFVTSVILGATTMTQLRTNIGAKDISLDDEVMTEIENIHRTHTNPCP